MDEVLQLGSKELKQIYDILARDKITKKELFGEQTIKLNTAVSTEKQDCYGFFDDFGDFFIEARIANEKNLRRKRT